MLRETKSAYQRLKDPLIFFQLVMFADKTSHIYTYTMFTSIYLSRNNMSFSETKIWWEEVAVMIEERYQSPPNDSQSLAFTFKHRWLLPSRAC